MCTLQLKVKNTIFTECLTRVQAKKGATKKQFEVLNQAVLIEYESRFCYCMAYFSHEMFSETCFSLQFSS